MAQEPGQSSGAAGPSRLPDAPGHGSSSSAADDAGPARASTSSLLPVPPDQPSQPPPPSLSPHLSPSPSPHIRFSDELNPGSAASIYANDGSARDAAPDAAHTLSLYPRDQHQPPFSRPTPKGPLQSGVELTTIWSQTEGDMGGSPQPPAQGGSSSQDESTPAPRQLSWRRRFPALSDLSRGVTLEESPISPTRPREGQSLNARPNDAKNSHAAGAGAMTHSVLRSSSPETSRTLALYREWVARQRERRRRWKNGPWGRLRARCGALYKKWVVEGLLRQRSMPPSKDGRHIPLRPGFVRRKALKDERTGCPYVPNFIRSSRYTVYNLIPKQVIFQFGKLANFYFLIIGIMQMIPGLSTTGSYTTIGPLMAFVAISMGKEGYDDYRRYRLDRTENRSEAWVLDPERSVRSAPRKGRKWFGLFGGRRKPAASGLDVGLDDLESTRSEPGSAAAAVDGDEIEKPELWSKVLWQDVRVGDVVQLRRDEAVPADMVLLHASGPDGAAFIETMALDGETNLKNKQASSKLAEHCTSTADMAACEAVVVSEDPNLDLYNYEGRVTLGGETMPLTMNQVIYRGSTLRNTSRAIGLVVNTGEECKIRMNSNKNVSAKAPELQYAVNHIIVMLVVFVVVLSVGCTAGNLIWRNQYEVHAWYLQGYIVQFKEILIGFIIMFNTLIPLSLYVSLEMIKLAQLYLLQDVEMYDPKTDTPMVAHTSTILENLGQVGYVFSDKTGTLTENVMRFRKISVAGTAWLHDVDIKREAAQPAPALSTHRRKSSKHQKRASRSRLSLSGSLGAKVNPDVELMNEPLMETSLDLSRSSSNAGQWKSSTRPNQVLPGGGNTQDLLRYIRRKPNTPFSRKARHLILCMALCHTCLPETGPDGEVEFQAASPDEQALVEGARDLGFLLIDRPAQSVKLQFRGPDSSLVTEEYQVLDVIEFSSKRKRMSIIIRMPDGRLCIFTKGADSVVLPRLKQTLLAFQKASAVERRASVRKSVEQERALRRRSTQGNLPQSRGSFHLVRAATSVTHRSRGSKDPRKAPSLDSRTANLRKASIMIMDEVDTWLTQRETEDLEHRTDAPMEVGVASTTTPTTLGRSSISGSLLMDEQLVDESIAVDDGAIFERCFQHVDDFACEGLRTLIFAYRYLEEEDYIKWKRIYHEATTSLVNRQDCIEEAAELIERDFDLAGATAIEDKLQQGVPETIDKLRRANIKVWMLTGDKRETAINIAHSARICKPYSEVYILDATEKEASLQEKLASTLVDIGRSMVLHSVVVIDGHTLGVISDPAGDESLRALFYDLAARVDSVICCRASPSQKAALVKCIRGKCPKAVTLAVGDGANDIAMIQASHVGIGISGREGLQAARISDYSIAQFRFLQRLLFVHGRWNYSRTAKYILGTFWKEMVFYLVQAQYQHFNGYTGTSLYESASLTVFNTLFTSLPVILLGIFEKDLAAETLLAVPELYTFGQRNKAFNLREYVFWMFMAASEAVFIFVSVYFVFLAAGAGLGGGVPPLVDNSLYPLGGLAFTVCVIFVNLKMLVLELHNRTVITMAGLLLSIGGWFAWGLFLAAIYRQLPAGIYVVRHSLTHGFGRSATWWITGVAALSVVIVWETGIATIRRSTHPTDTDVMQEVEQLDGIREVLRDHADDGPQRLI